VEQEIINWLLGAFGAVIGFLLNCIWQAIKDLQRTDTEIVTRVNHIEVLVAGNYINRTEFDKTITRLFLKLDEIGHNLSKKADK